MRVMPTPTSAFDYHLPPECIAQHSVEPRDQSRLLVLDRKAATWSHHRFFEIGSFLQPGDLLVVNETKVFNARLTGHVGTLEMEIFLLRPDGNQWLALARPGRKLRISQTITFSDNRTCVIREKKDDGTVLLDFHASADNVLAWADRVGSIPVPPYVNAVPASSESYQTVYAKQVGSVAAPTAGFHFTRELIERLKSRGIQFATVILHVGLGTFRPIKTDTIEAHDIHEEWIDVPEETQRLIAETKARGGRVIAVGTTTVRALESDIATGFTKTFITPGYRFKRVDGLITNFHLPKSSLLVLVSAFIGERASDPDEGRQVILAAYQDAITKHYRFYSFGDAMLIV
jgi:S-adenosylmethionine:tRNA ribosyltransferase-isomerase